jgi:hypothetical protein
MRGAMRTPRLRGTTAMVLGVIDAALLVAALASFRWTAEYNSRDSWWTLQNGRYRVGWYYVPRNRRGVDGWHVTRNDSVAWEWAMQVPRVRLSGGPFGFVSVPLWIPIFAMAGVTAWAWRRWRGFGPGRCARCGYDLTGAATGVCPECGPGGPA